MEVSRVQSHGPDEKYVRVVVPVRVSREMGVKKGAVVAWEILDGKSMILKIVGV